MRVLILVFAWIFIAFPVSGQLHQEILRRAEQANVSSRSRIEQMDDLGWGVTQNDTEDGIQKRILIGAGIGLIVGFEIGWRRDDPDGTLFSWMGQRRDLSQGCISDFETGGCRKEEHTARYRIIWSLTGIGAGGALGWLWPFGGDDDDPD